jgi:hypothetical protein
VRALAALYAVAVAAGLASALLVIWLLAFGTAGPGLFVCDVVLLALAGALAWRWAWRGGAEGGAVRQPARGWAVVLLAVAFVLAFAAWAIDFAVQLRAEPHGGWDAWTIWDLRARFLHRLGPDWRDAFLPELRWTLNDYPLLLPGLIAHAWAGVGETQLVPALAAAFFCFGCVALLALGVGVLRGAGQGLLAGVALLGSGPLLRQGATLYADLPLAFHCLAALVAWCLYDRARGRPGGWIWLATSGLTAALAAWTKNEGLAFFAAVSLAAGVATLRAHGPRAALRDAAVFLAGALPVLCVLATFKLGVAPRNYLFAEQTAAGLAAQLLDPARWRATWAALGAQLLAFGGVLSGSLWVALAVYALLAGVRPRAEWRAAGVVAASVALLLAADVAVYLATPLDLAWQLEMSANRLVAQLVPSALLAFFLWVRTPSVEADEVAAATPGAAP